MPKKSLVIGLGGTGDWVLTFLKSRLYAAYGSDAVDKDVQFLLVDTIEPRQRESALKSDGANNKIVVGVAGEQHEEQVARLGRVHLEAHEYLGMVGEAHSTARKILEDDPYTRHLDWFPAGFYLNNLPAAALNISMGAGQWRQIGRLAMFLHSSEFVNRVERLIARCNVQQGETLMVYLVCSLGGGTGAGMFLDAAALIRKIVGERSGTSWIIGFLLLPGAFKKVWGDSGSERAVPRSYAAYRELNRFQTEAGRNVPFPIAYSSGNENHVVKTVTKLYDTVFLADAVGDLMEASPWEGVSPSIADALEVFIDRTRGWRILENLINASAKTADQVRMNKTNPAQFHSVGSHKIVLPARQYGHMFTSRFVREFLDKVFPTQYVAKKPVALEESPVSDHDHEKASREFMKTASHLFLETIEYLPGGTKSAKSFGDATLRDYGALLRPKKDTPGRPMSFAMLEADPLDREDEERAIQISRDEEPEEGARRIAREVERKLSAYFTKLTELLTGAANAVASEVTAALDERIERILNGKVEGYQERHVHAAIRFASTISSQAELLNVDVIGKASERFKQQHGSPQWALRVAQARAEMEGKFEGWFSGKAAAKAQRSYIDASGDFAEARKVEVMFDTFMTYVNRLKEEADRVQRQLTHWAGLATRTDTSAAMTAQKESARIEAETIEAGKTYTSSYGLRAYNGSESSVDVTMGGYSDVLYARLTSELMGTWLAALEWRYADHQPALELKGIAPEKALAGVESGEDLYRHLFDLAHEKIAPQTHRLSIFDYFLHQRITSEQVAKFLEAHTVPLMGELGPGAQPTRELYLLVQRAQSVEAATFLNELRDAFGRTIFNSRGEILQGGATDDFDNPYALTLLYLMQDVRDGQIALLNESERTYEKALYENDVHLVNHTFRAEREATRIEKIVNYVGGRTGAESDGFFRIHPRVTRLLDQPGRMQQFVQLLVLDVARFVETFDGSGSFVWMVLPPEQIDRSRAPWLTRKAVGAEDQRVNMSLILAAEQFCLAGVSANPASRLPIPYSPEIDRLIQTRNKELRSAGGFAKVIETYEKYLQDGLPETLEHHMRATLDVGEALHSDEERESMKAVIGHFLQQETAKQKMLSVAAR